MRLLAVLIGLVGLVWLGQGVGAIPGSFMTGSQLWAAIGAVLVVVAVLLALWEYRRRR
jgi:membrane protein implicated in regulation of membrane protease activity